MTAPLRRAHLRIWLVLTVLLGLLIAAALASRRNTMPLNEIRWEEIR